MNYRYSPPGGGRPAAWLGALLFLGLLVQVPALARRTDTAAAAAPTVAGQCTVCHGTGGAGNPVVQAPTLAGLPAWYVLAQLRAYREGLRGTHPDDGHGHTMAAVARSLAAEELEAAAAWVAALPVRRGPARVTGDAQRGAVLYRACGQCHGRDGGGDRRLAAPPLAGQSDWYVVRQLRNYRDGLRGAHPDDRRGAVMRAAAIGLSDADIGDVAAHVASLAPEETFVRTTLTREAHAMNRSASTNALPATALALGLAAGAATLSAPADAAEGIVRYPLPDNSTFPIARAVETPPGTTLIHHSGLTPRPANPDAERGTRWYWGDTRTQALSVFSRMEDSLTDLGLGFGDIIKMTVFLVGDEELGGRMDFSGFMEAYTQYFGTGEQPNLPARSAVQVAGLAAEGMLVEIEVILARPPAPSGGD